MTVAIKPSIAAKLLSRAAARDNRNPTDAAALAWAEDLDDHVTEADGAQAISEHYRHRRDFVMPSDINIEVARIRKTRTDRIAGEDAAPSVLDDQPQRAIAYTREYRRAIGDGEDHDAAVKRACDAVGIEVPAQIEAVPRPDAVKQLMAAHGAQCECGCLTRRIRRGEGEAK